MPGYNHLLLAVDFETDVVTLRAAELAQSFGAKLSMIHVIDLMAAGIDWGETVWTAVGTPPESVEPVYQREIRQAQIGLKQLAERAAIQPESARVAVASSTEAAIHEAARKCGADLIVVGSDDRHGLSLLLGGSTARSVLGDAPCDVLAIRFEEED